MTTGVHEEGKHRLTAGETLFRLAGLGVMAPPLAIAVSALTGLGHRGPDLLAQFAAPAVPAVLAIACGFMLLRRWRWTVAAAAVGCLLLAAVWPQWFPPTGRPQPGAASIRLYSANVWARNRDVDAIAASIRQADADIVLLIELGDAPAAQLDRVLEGYPHRVTTPRIARSSGAARSAIASRYPLNPIPDRPDGLHSVAALVQTPLGPVNVLGVHLTRPWPFQEQWGQISQTMALTDLRRSLTGPVIVAGDFNSVSDARIGRQVKADIGLIPAPSFPGTWPAALPGPLRTTIDQVWRSPDLALTARRLGRPTGSDHRPVVVDFTRAAT